MTHKIFRLVSSLFLALAVTAIASTPQSARAAGPWYVSTTGDDNNDCLSPNMPCATINGAIGKATNGDTINVAVGTYTSTGNEVVLIDKDATLAGGWDASFTTQSGMSTVDGQGARRGITVNSGVTAMVEHFALQNGNVTGNGGGVLNAGTVIITDSTISSNIAGSGVGSGIYNTNSGVLTLNNSTVNHNGSTQICFVIANEGTFTANDSLVEENTTTQSYCVATIVISFSGAITLTNTAIRNNSIGGGIYNYATLTLNSSVISGNVNTASNGPGGIYNWGGTLNVNNSTISGNTTSSGGGIFAGGGGIVRLNNGTVSNNTASTGGGIYNYPSSPADIIMQNTILAGNTATNTGPDCNGSIGSSGYNLIGDTSNCNFTPGNGDLTNVDPILNTLQDNGGPTFTHALLPSSPAIDAGNPAGCTDQNSNLLTTDQRGVARPQGARCDIGSFELEATGGGSEEITIDIKPGRFPNRIKLTRNVCNDDDNLYVAILTTPDFDARTVDVSSLKLGDPNLSGTATPIRSRIRDIDLDGDKDMALTFTLCSIVTNGALNRSSTELVLTGKTLDGVSITGRDSVKVVGRSYP